MALPNEDAIEKLRLLRLEHSRLCLEMVESDRVLKLTDDILARRRAEKARLQDILVKRRNKRE
jgi:hypothetical protein